MALLSASHQQGHPFAFDANDRLYCMVVDGTDGLGIKYSDNAGSTSWSTASPSGTAPTHWDTSSAHWCEIEGSGTDTITIYNERAKIEYHTYSHPTTPNQWGTETLLNAPHANANTIRGMTRRVNGFDVQLFIGHSEADMGSNYDRVSVAIDGGTPTQISSNGDALNHRPGAIIHEVTSTDEYLWVCYWIGTNVAANTSLKFRKYTWTGSAWGTIGAEESPVTNTGTSSPSHRTGTYYIDSPTSTASTNARIVARDGSNFWIAYIYWTDEAGSWNSGVDAWRGGPNPDNFRGGSVDQGFAAQSVIANSTFRDFLVGHWESTGNPPYKMYLTERNGTEYTDFDEAGPPAPTFISQLYSSGNFDLGGNILERSDGFMFFFTALSGSATNTDLVEVYRPASATLEEHSVDMITFVDASKVQQHGSDIMLEHVPTSYGEQRFAESTAFNTWQGGGQYAESYSYVNAQVLVHKVTLEFDGPPGTIDFNICTAGLEDGIPHQVLHTKSLVTTGGAGVYEIPFDIPVRLSHLGETTYYRFRIDWTGSGQLKVDTNETNTSDPVFAYWRDPWVGQIWYSYWDTRQKSNSWTSRYNSDWQIGHQHSFFCNTKDTWYVLKESATANTAEMIKSTDYGATWTQVYTWAAPDATHTIFDFIDGAIAYDGEQMAGPGANLDGSHLMVVMRWHEFVNGQAYPNVTDYTIIQLDDCVAGTESVQTARTDTGLTPDGYTEYQSAFVVDESDGTIRGFQESYGAVWATVEEMYWNGSTWSAGSRLGYGNYIYAALKHLSYTVSGSGAGDVYTPTRPALAYANSTGTVAAIHYASGNPVDTKQTWIRYYDGSSLTDSVTLSEGFSSELTDVDDTGVISVLAEGTTAWFPFWYVQNKVDEPYRGYIRLLQYGFSGSSLVSGIVVTFGGFFQSAQGGTFYGPIWQFTDVKYDRDNNQFGVLHKVDQRKYTFQMDWPSYTLYRSGQGGFINQFSGRVLPEPTDYVRAGSFTSMNEYQFNSYSRTNREQLYQSRNGEWIIHLVGTSGSPDEHYWYRFPVTGEQHYADVFVTKVFPKHDADVSLYFIRTHTHNADLLVVDRQTVAHSADLFLVDRYTLAHSTDVVLVQRVRHESDLLLQGDTQPLQPHLDVETNQWDSAPVLGEPLWEQVNEAVADDSDFIHYRKPVFSRHQSGLWVADRLSSEQSTDAFLVDRLSSTHNADLFSNGHFDDFATNTLSNYTITGVTPTWNAGGWVDYSTGDNNVTDMRYNITSASPQGYGYWDLTYGSEWDFGDRYSFYIYEDANNYIRLDFADSFYGNNYYRYSGGSEVENVDLSAGVSEPPTSGNFTFSYEFSSSNVTFGLDSGTRSTHTPTGWISSVSYVVLQFSQVSGDLQEWKVNFT